ncbi:hypothetical protein VTO42DRAFT_8554 [Malbranchea cinnamomea]
MPSVVVPPRKPRPRPLSGSACSSLALPARQTNNPSSPILDDRRGLMDRHRLFVCPPKTLLHRPEKCGGCLHGVSGKNEKRLFPIILFDVVCGGPKELTWSHAQIQGICLPRRAQHDTQNDSWWPGEQTSWERASGKADKCVIDGGWWFAGCRFTEGLTNGLG